MAAQAGWDHYQTHWEAQWRDGIKPSSRWDIGQASPQLQQLLRSGDLAVKGKRAVVPGCGRGYDVAAFAQAGADATGLDISTTAIRDAEAYLHETLDADCAQHARIMLGDFLKDTPSTSYDVGYDYTFGCAMHPDMRSAWAAGWARHLAKGGELVTLVFPVDPTRDRMQGPPYPVTPELYTELLTAVGFENVHLEPVPHELSHPARAGREWLGRWRAPGPPAAANSKI